MNVSKLAPKDLRYIIPDALLGTRRTKQILSANPKVSVTRKDSDAIRITAYDYNINSFSEHDLRQTEHCFK